MPDIERGVVRTDSGVFLPPRANFTVAGGKKISPRLKHMIESGRNSYQFSAGFNHGLRLDRDDSTLIIRWQRKGCGYDDLVNQAIADGTIANAGISPVIFPQIPGLLGRQQSQARSAVLNIQGRKTPVARIQKAISMFNDSPLGITDAIAQIVYQLRVYNRGAPISTVPIIYPVDTWEERGLEAIPFDSDAANTLYFLQVDWSRHGTPIPFLPSVFDLEPTGNNEWPYWYRKNIGGKDSWVLLHNTHIIGVTPGHSGQNGVGTSSVYMCLGFLGEHVLVIDERTERQVSSQPDGILAVNGIDMDPDILREEIDAEDWLAKGQGNYLHKGFTVLTSETPITFESFRLRQDDGVEFEQRRQYYEDILSLAFEEALVALVTRGGIGFGVQSGTAASSASDAGVNSILHTICVALSAIYPRVTFSLSRTNDQAQRNNLEALSEFSSAFRNLEGVLTAEEARAIIDQQIMKIPDTGGDNVSVDDHGDVDEEPNDRTGEQVENAVRINRLYLQSLALFSKRKRFVPVEDVESTAEFEQFRQIILDGLTAQNASLDIIQLVNDLDDPADLDEILLLVEERMNRLEDETDTEALLLLLLLFGGLGQDFMLDQAAVQDVEPTADESAQISDDIEVNSGARISELFVEGSGESDVIFDPSLPSTLDAASYAIMASLIHTALQIADDPAEVNQIVRSEQELRSASRSQLIADNESSHAHGHGAYAAADTLDGQTKTWLLTTSADPREVHLQDVGITVPFRERFPNGDFWSQERVNCKCGIQVNFDRS